MSRETFYILNDKVSITEWTKKEFFDIQHWIGNSYIANKFLLVTLNVSQHQWQVRIERLCKKNFVIEHLSYKARINESISKSISVIVITIFLIAKKKFLSWNIHRISYKFRNSCYPCYSFAKLKLSQNVVYEIETLSPLVSISTFSSKH